MWEVLILCFILVLVFVYFILIPLRRGVAPVSLTTEKAKNRMAKDLDYLFIFMPIEMVNFIKILGMIFFGLLGYIITYNMAPPGPYAAAAVCTCLGYFLPELILWHMKRRRREKFSEQVIDALVLMSNGLRSGFTMQQALEMLTQEAPNPMAQEIELVMRENSLGVDINTCLMNSCERTQDADFELAMTAVNIARSLGGNLAEIFDRIVEMVRDRKVLEGKARAVTSQGRMQAGIVGLLPIVFGYFVIKINPDMMRLMWTTVPGFVALTIILVLDIAGYFWTMKLSQIDY